MLRLNNISKIFNKGTVNEKTALDNLSLNLKEGDFATVIGGNGSGKSTLLNSVAGTFFLNDGQILIDGHDITFEKEDKRARYFGRVFQDPMMGTAGGMQIEENLAMANRKGKKRGLSWAIKKSERSFFKSELSKLELGLEDRMTSKVGLLSGGQRQALTLLMATLKKPKVLLLDEHTAALDPKTAARVLFLTEEFVKKDRLTTLMITHNMKDAIRVGNRLIMIYDGKIIFDVSGEEKSLLSSKDLLEKFQQASDGQFHDDRVVLTS